MNYAEIAEEMTRRGYKMGPSAVGETLIRAHRKLAEGLEFLREDLADEPTRSVHRRNRKLNTRRVR